MDHRERLGSPQSSDAIRTVPMDITAQIVQSSNMHETGVTGKSEGFGKGDLVS